MDMAEDQSLELKEAHILTHTHMLAHASQINTFLHACPQLLRDTLGVLAYLSNG